MKPSQHIIASAVVSVGFQAVMHSWPATLGCFLSGVLIDTDHYLDYVIVRRKFPFRYKDLVEFCWDKNATKLYLLFHAYELLLLFWFLIYFMGLGKIWIGIALGLTVHLLFDQWTNPIKPFFYFLIYRMKNNFEKSKVLSDKYFIRPEMV